MDSKRALSVFALIAVLPLVSAVPECALGHYMPEGAWLYQALLCVSEPYHGWIYTVAPPGIPQQLKMFKVQLQSYAYVPPYAATLNCYEQFTDVEPPSRMGGKSGTPNSVPPKPQYSWHFKSTVTLNAGEITPPGSEWTIAECPPIKNYGQPLSDPAEVLIYLAWNGELPGNRMTAAPVEPVLSVNPFVSALDGAISLGETPISALPAKKAMSANRRAGR
ncbi:hypothetical protein COU36_03875 [Candidatus Micrarchaeota archaeon CG10_big_fil_rev_8_21_14_0_10_59_7]|nr:MAG: hypothetical protein COU36_03875 [Candidatus Micrarchaeota archaeon CG10_big_fil_rev_8_21_14_0_10_59_7]